MGGDYGPRVTLPASLSALKRHPNLRILLAGDLDALQLVLSNQRVSDSVIARLELIPCGDSVSMDDKPSYAVRNRKDSSMSIAVKLIAEGKADACVSAGNTGALMAFGRLYLKMQPGIDRPAITTSVPTMKGHCYMLDLGANVDCSADHLLQFAIMGSVMSERVDGLEQPKIGLLNIGEESNKGNEQVKLANDLLLQHPELNYIGYIEGDDVFSGKADVVVCDGFVGNIALKSSEGLSRLIRKKVRNSFSTSWYRKFLALLASPVLQEIQVQMDPSRRNGASMLGLQGIVMKSHGGATRKGFGYAISQAISEAQQNVPEQISIQLKAFHDKDPR